MKQLIVTADDFGLTAEVNEAVEQAHQKGILTGASLMMSAAATDDAIERARNLPELRVGLHVVLVDGKPSSPPADIPNLVDADGRFSRQLVRTGVRYFFSPRVRAQLEAEVRAQFQAFATTGLELDHVNAHHHMHLHPTVADLIVSVGREYSLRAVRIPDEPPLPALCAQRAELHKRKRQRRWLSPWVKRLRRTCAKQGLKCNDQLLGLYDSGELSVEKLVRMLAHVPDGITEIMTHPVKHATSPGAHERAQLPGHEELRALLHPRVARSIDRFAIQLTSFGALSA